MELWAYIKGNRYPIALGPSLIDAMGEELDSMNIVVPHVSEIEGLKPYDDVYISDSDEYPAREYGYIYDGSSDALYRHFLAYNIQKTEVNNVDGVYTYSISLISETKMLEKIPLPNRTITNPLNRKGKTVYWHANHFVDRYSPLIKVSMDGETWTYRKKYIISTTAMENEYTRGRMLKSVMSVFAYTYVMECSFNSPTLREVLTKLFQAKNCIPVVLDGVIFCREISGKRNRLTSIPGKIWDTLTFNGDEYCDRLRKNYSNGLTGKNGCVFHEYVGFRNIGEPSMRFSDLKIELKNPIYRIDKFYICYYSRENNGRLTKLDMTGFVVPNSTRSLLSNDWIEYDKQKPQTLNGYVNADGNYVTGICDYRFNTVGYDIGSNYIEGFGETRKYTINGIDYTQKSILENIMNIAINEKLGDVAFEDAVEYDTSVPTNHKWNKRYYYFNDIVAPEIQSEWWADFKEMIDRWVYDKTSDTDGTLSESTLKMKTIFFEVEYQGFVSSAVVVSKDLHDGDVWAIDNQQESMALTEFDGIVSKVKANRLGNEVSNVTARVSDFSDLVEIGDYDEDHGICYKRTISLEKDFISASYSFAKDYVLMNYFTSVFSKYRSSAYASFDQSVERSENRTIQMYISDSELYDCDKGTLNFSYSLELEGIFGILKNTYNHGSIFYFSSKVPVKKTYSGEYDDSDLETRNFAMDRAYYMSGDSLCITAGMPDSVTAGTYIRQLYPDVSDVTKEVFSAWGRNNDESIYAIYAKNDSPINDVTGVMQEYLSLPKSRYDGSVDNITFSCIFGSYSQMESTYNPMLYPDGRNMQETIEEVYNDHLLKLPMVNESIISQLDDSNSISTLEKYKDSKEIINETFEIEPVAKHGIGISFSPYFLKLSDLSNFEGIKSTETRTIPKESDILLSFTDQMGDSVFAHSIAIYTQRNDNNLEMLPEIVDVPINAKIEYYRRSALQNDNNDRAKLFTVEIHKIKKVTEKYIVVEMSFDADIPLIDDVGNIEAYQSLGRYSEIKRHNFYAMFYNADYVMESRELVENPHDEDFTMDYQNPKRVFYTGDNLRTTRYFTLYNDVTVDDSDNVYGDMTPIYLESIMGRKCFCFNFDLFPNKSIATRRSDGVEVEINLDQTESFDDLDYKTLFFASQYGYCKYIDIQKRATPQTDFKDYIGPGKSQVIKLSDISPDRIVNQTMFWFASEADTEIDKLKTYESEADAVSDGLSPVSNVLRSISESRRRVAIYANVADWEGDSLCLSLFYLDSDGLLHFVFKCIAERMNGDNFQSEIYVSLLPDRSLTVYNGRDMKPSYRVRNDKGNAIDGIGKVQQEE